MGQRGIQYQGTTAVTAYINGRTLVVANAGDARAVLGRGGKATRLSYDDKASDATEAERVLTHGGFVANARVNGTPCFETCLYCLTVECILKQAIISGSLFRSIDVAVVMLSVCTG